MNMLSQLLGITPNYVNPNQALVTDFPKGCKVKLNVAPEVMATKYSYYKEDDVYIVALIRYRKNMPNVPLAQLKCEDGAGGGCIPITDLIRVLD